MIVWLAVIWLLIMAAAISSIWSQARPRRWRMFWILMVVGVPGLGLLLYLPVSFRKGEDLSVTMGLPGFFGSKRR